MSLPAEVLFYLGWPIASVVVPMLRERMIREKWITEGIYNYEKDIILISSTSALIVFIGCSPFLYNVFVGLW